MANILVMGNVNSDGFVNDQQLKSLYEKVIVDRLIHMQTYKSPLTLSSKPFKE